MHRFSHVGRLGPVCASLGVVTALALSTTSAHAGPFDDPYDLPDSPRPTVLPELTHPDLEATLESTLGTLTPRLGAPAGPSCDVCSSRFAFAQRIAIEVPLGPRRWFVGTNYALAAASSSGYDKFVSGNLELYGRTVWATRTGLALGGGLGLMLPTAHFDAGSPAANVASAAATLRPWDVSFFSSDISAIRPFVDVRDIVGRFVVHFRQGLDVITDFTHISNYKFTAVAELYVGYRIHRLLGVGLEAFELYLIDAPIDDRLRATFVVSPSVRVMTPYVQPALSAFTNIGPPLYGNADRIFGVRLAVTLVYDPRTQTIERGMPGHAGEPALGDFLSLQ